MQKLVCDICGGAIVVQSGGKYGVCDACGANYTIDRMREITSGIKVSQTGTSDDVQQWKALLDTYLSVFDWSAAESTVKKILEAVPSDEYALDIYRKLQKWKDYVIKDGVMLEYKGIDENLVIPYGVKVLRGIYKNRYGPTFQKPGNKTLKIPETVTDIEVVIDIAQYKEIFIPSSVKNIAYDAFNINGGFKDPYGYRDNFIKIYLPKRFMSQKFLAYRYTFDFAISDGSKSFYEKQGYIIDVCDYPGHAHVNYENEDFIFYDENETIDEVKARVAKEEEEAQKEFEKNQRDFRIYEGVCQHCGGDFKGIFNKVCSVCGKPKDY